jgi:hypothetical protein
MKPSGLSSRDPPYEQTACLHFLTLEIGICDDRKLQIVVGLMLEVPRYGILQAEKIGVKKQMLGVKTCGLLR